MGLAHRSHNINHNQGLVSTLHVGFSLLLKNFLTKISIGMSCDALCDKLGKLGKLGKQTVQFQMDKIPVAIQFQLDLVLSLSFMIYS